MTPGSVAGKPDAGSERLRQAETVLRRLGYARIPPVPHDTAVEPEFWVQEAGVPRRAFPVFLARSPATPELERVDTWLKGEKSPPSSRRAIVVVPTDRAADEAWRRVRQGESDQTDPDLAILVVPAGGHAGAEPHWHAVVVPPRELLKLASGVVMGLFQRAQAMEGTARIDFEEMLAVLKSRFRVDLYRSLGVDSDEDALFLLYQLALRYSYVPGDAGANVHTLVLKPTGPAARLPWFAA